MFSGNREKDKILKDKLEVGGEQPAIIFPISTNNGASWLDQSKDNLRLPKERLLSGPSDLILLFNFRLKLPGKLGLRLFG